jgi:serine/threonine protein kinase/WD40 repeat protein
MDVAPEQAPKRCRRCAEPLQGNALAGNCPRCLSVILLSPHFLNETHSPAETVLRRLGDYELLEEIARGGMGIVFRARQAGLGRFVAVKLLRDGLLANSDDEQRFQAEAAAAGRLRHPNIVALHSVGQEQGQRYLAMDYIAGLNLAQLARDGPLEPRRAAEITAQIADAIQHAHSQGILHRDLKPSNILMDAEGRPYVTDFGLSRSMDTSSSLTLTGQLLGTPAYMSPEQATTSAVVGPPSDVYSLGALLFHLLTGRPPFISNSVPELLRQVVKVEPLSPQLLNTSVPSQLATVCLKCLAKRAADRYQSARELEQDLRRFLRGEPVLARPASRGERLWRWCRREPSLAAAIAIALLVLVVGASVASWQWRRAEKEALTAKEQLWHAQLLEARSYRLNGGFGQRINTLETVARAAAHRPSVALRSEAIAALVLPDLGTNIWWHRQDNVPPFASFTGDFDFFLPGNNSGRVAICAASNQQPIIELDGPAAGIRCAKFSPDSRFLAVRFGNGEVRLWDWRASKLLLATQCWAGGVGDPVFDFSPDSHELWLADRAREIQCFSLPGGSRFPMPRVKIAAIGLCISADGRRLLTFDEDKISASDLTTGARLGQWTVPGEVWRVAWHPSARSFAVGAYTAGVYVGELGQPELSKCEAPEPSIAPTSLNFTPNGSFLLVGGWGNLFAIFDFATRKANLWSHQLWFGQLSEDGQRVALFDEGRGYGVRRFINPTGISRLPVPGELLGEVYAAAWHPARGGWLALAHYGGWSVWNGERGELIATHQMGYCRSLQFARDGSGFLTGGADGPVFWPWRGDKLKPQIGQPRRLLPANSGANERAALSPDGKIFAAVGTNGTFIGSTTEDSPCVVLHDVPADSVEFSPDGRWLKLGSHHDTAVHIRSPIDGSLVTNLPTGSSHALFVPGSNQLLAMGPGGISVWQLGTWQKLRELPAQGDNSYDVVDFGPNASWAFANAKDLLLHVWDLNANREIASLRLPESSAAWSCIFDPSHHFVAATGSHPFLWLWDLGSLRRELNILSLDWPDKPPDGNLQTH